MQNFAPTCPRCGARLVHRVKRPAWMRILFFWLPLRRYFCYRCYRRVYILSSGATD